MVRWLPSAPPLLFPFLRFHVRFLPSSWPFPLRCHSPPHFSISGTRRRMRRHRPAIRRMRRLGHKESPSHTVLQPLACDQRKGMLLLLPFVEFHAPPTRVRPIQNGGVYQGGKRRKARGGISTPVIHCKEVFAGRRLLHLPLDCFLILSSPCGRFHIFVFFFLFVFFFWNRMISAGGEWRR